MSSTPSIEMSRLFVSIVPSFEGIEGKIGEQFGAPLKREATKAGKDSGDSFGGTFGDFAKKAIIAAGIGAVVVSSFNNAIENEKSTNKMAAAMGLTPEESAKYGALAGSLYANNYGENMAEVTGAIDSVASTLVKTGKAGEDQLEGLTGKALSLAGAFEVDVSEAANTAGVMLNSGLAKNAEEAFDLIAKAGQSVPAAMRGEIFPVMDEYSKHFAALGMDGPKAFSIMTIAAQDGAIGMDKAGDALKEFQIRSTDMSKATGTAYEALGLDTQEMTNAILGGGAGANEAFQKIVNGLQLIEDPAEQSAAALALFGTPLEDLGVDKIPDFLNTIDPMADTLNDTAGAAGKLDETMGQGAGANLQKFTRAWEGVTTGLATSALPMLTAVMEKTLPFIEGLKPFAPILIGVAVAFGILAAAMWVASLTPITLIIGAIILGIALLIGAIVAIASNWTQIWDGMSIVMGGFFNWIGELLGGFANWWNQIWGGFATGVTDLWNGITGGIKTIWDGFMAWLQPGLDVLFAITNTAWRLIADGAKLILGGFFNWVKEIWDGFVVWITPAFTFFGALWNAAWTAVSSFAIGVWNGIVSWIQGVWNGLVAWASPALNFFAGIWNAVWTAVSGFVSGIWEQISGAVKSGADQVFGWVNGLGEQVGGFFGGLANTAFTWGSNIIQGLLDGLKSMGGNVGSFFSTLIPGWIIDPFKEALDIHSPSRVFYELGGFTGQGFLDGADSKKALIKKSMQSLVTVPEQPRGSTTLAYATPAGGSGDTYNVHPSAEMDEELLTQHIANIKRRKERR